MEDEGLRGLNGEREVIEFLALLLSLLLSLLPSLRAAVMVSVAAIAAIRGGGGKDAAKAPIGWSSMIPIG